MVTPNETIVAEEQKEETRAKELVEKTDRTPEENTELDGLKEKKTGRFQKRIDTLTWKSKTAEEKLETEKAERERLQKENDELRSTQLPPKPQIKEETIDIGGKKYFTDASLSSQIDAGKITEAEGIRHQKERNKEEAVVEAVGRIENKTKEKEDKNILKEDFEDVFKRHPEWAEKHQNHNPNDPLYIKTNELYLESYRFLPDGLSKAEELAKQLLNISSVHIDRTEDLSVIESGVPKPTGRKLEEETFTEGERDTATKQYRDIINPKTGRVYTENEILTKALAAKKARKR
jgi:hypothetical protein